MKINKITPQLLWQWEKKQWLGDNGNIWEYRDMCRVEQSDKHKGTNGRMLESIASTCTTKYGDNMTDLVLYHWKHQKPHRKCCSRHWNGKNMVNICANLFEPKARGDHFKSLICVNNKWQGELEGELRWNCGWWVDNWFRTVLYLKYFFPLELVTYFICYPAYRGFLNLKYIFFQYLIIYFICWSPYTKFLDFKY